MNYVKSNVERVNFVISMNDRLYLIESCDEDNFVIMSIIKALLAK